MSSPQGETPASQQEQPAQPSPAATPPAESPSPTPAASPAQAAQARQSGQPERLAEAVRQTQNAQLTQTAPESQGAEASQPSQPSEQPSQAAQQGQDVPATTAPPVAPISQEEGGQPQESPTHQSPASNAPQAPPSAEHVSSQASSVEFKFVSGATPVHQPPRPQKPRQVQQVQQVPPPRLQEPPNPARDMYAFYGQQQEMRRDHLYATLGALDPYRATPKEFIHLLVNAALRDEEISQSIYRMNEDRLHNPQYWIPVHQLSVRGLPGQPHPQPHHQPPPPPPPPPYMNPHLPPFAPGHHGFPPVAQPPSPYFPHVIYYAPQNPPFYAQPMSNPPPNTVVLPHPPRGPISSQQTSPSQSESSIGPVVPAPRPGPLLDSGDAAVGNTTDSAIELDDEPPEPKEQPCNFTWVVDRVEVHLGWTGNWDKMSEIRQTSIGYDVALKLQKLQRKMNAMMDKYAAFSNRVHILTVMRELMAATLETDSRVGRECRECAREFDDNFVDAVRKLTPPQRRRLKVLEGGRWVRELQELVDEAKRQSLFRRLEQALVCIDS